MANFASIFAILLTAFSVSSRHKSTSLNRFGSTLHFRSRSKFARPKKHAKPFHKKQTYLR